MKSNYVRGLVFLMALTGIGATTISSRAATANGSKAIAPAPANIPPALCPYNDPNACGIS
jgi:hypothetical protein